MKEDLANREEVLIYLAAQGKTNSEIAALLDCSTSTVSSKMQEDRIQFEIRHVRQKLYGKDPKSRFQAMLPDALDVTEQILQNPNAKPQLRFQAAQEVMDRALGRPTQTVEHQGSLIRSLFERLDADKNPVQTIDITPDKRFLRNPELENPNETVAPKTSQDNPNFNKVDDWVSKNL